MFLMPKSVNGKSHKQIVEASRKRARVQFRVIHDLGWIEETEADVWAQAKAEHPHRREFLDHWQSQVRSLFVTSSLSDVRAWSTFARAYEDHAHIRAALVRWEAEALDLLEDPKTLWTWKQFSIPSPWGDRVCSDWVEANERKVASLAPRGVPCFVALGLTFPSTVDEIQAAYRRLAVEAHPDRGGSNEAMAALTKARATALSMSRYARPRKARA
ncbi:J domain-containing protein [Paludisphaera borealis]|uniref:J domain-containing protein n=1 Tax=Paludisphaera borealis TaxID=1387353 RepID=A0A1U7CPA9_9BACT|nr:J domain-containing protein [Paludisphaera borealis]APW60767.1 hypothetical protein BSF38_02256 [Paludisphaera borealis]